MRVSQPELWCEVLRAVADGEPFSASFVYIGDPFDIACVDRTDRYWRCSLLGFIKDDLTPVEQELIETLNHEIVYGCLEWESPNELMIRDSSGHEVSDVLDQSLRSAISQWGAR